MTAKSVRTIRGPGTARRCGERRPRPPGDRGPGGGDDVDGYDGSFPPFHTPVRGYRFAARPPGAAHPRPGQRAGLRREDDHPVDPWAVGVWVRAEDGAPWRIGYLERAVAARLGPRLDEGMRASATVAGWTPEPEGRWRRPIVRVEPDGYSGADSRDPPRGASPPDVSRGRRPGP